LFTRSTLSTLLQ